MKHIDTETAAAYCAAGLCALPASRERKRPVTRGWKQYQTRRPDEAETRRLFAGGPDAICVVTGAASGDLECIDFDAHGPDGVNLFEAWRSLAAGALGDAFVAKLTTETTQRGGVHVYYRAPHAAIEGNLKLAQRPGEGGRPETWIETRGEGGLVLCAPTEGYEPVQGDLLGVPTITAEQRACLLALARSLDECGGKAAPAPEPAPAPAAAAARPALPASAPWATRPGDDFNVRGVADGTFERALVASGWRKVRGGPNEGWQRPGKEGDEQSATFNGRTFYVFSSNAAPLEPNTGYSPFSVLVALQFGGDARAAAAELARRGYGEGGGAAGAEALGFTPGGEDDPRVVTHGPEDEEVAPAPPKPRRATQPLVDPERLTMPGFVDEMTAHILAGSPLPNRPLAFAAALALLAFLAGRRYTTERGDRPALYILSLARSSTGKNAPLNAAMTMAARLGLADGVATDFASAEGLLDALRALPVRLVAMDEAQRLFSALADKGEEAQFSRKKEAVLLDMWDKHLLVRADKAVSSLRHDKLPPRRELPSLTFWGSMTPTVFWKGATPAMVSGGLFGRFLVFDATELRANPHATMAPPPPALLSAARLIVSRGADPRRDDEGVADARFVVPFEPDADALQAELFVRLTEKRNALMSDPDNEPRCMLSDLVGREIEKTKRLALLFAISENPDAPIVTRAGIEWAYGLVNTMHARLFRRAMENLGDTPEMRLANRMRAFVERAGAPVQHSALWRAFGGDSRVRRDALAYLLDSGYLVRVEPEGRKGAWYAAAAENEEQL